MKKKTILLLGRNDLLSVFVELLLSDHAGWEVVPVSVERDPDETFKALERYEPDVVISQEETGSMDTEILLILFHNNPALKVITLNLDNNLMEIYSKQNVLVQSTADLISAIED